MEQRWDFAMACNLLLVGWLAMAIVRSGVLRIVRSGLERLSAPGVRYLTTIYLESSGVLAPDLERISKKERIRSTNAN